MQANLRRAKDEKQRARIRAEFNRQTQNFDDSAIFEASRMIDAMRDTKAGGGSLMMPPEREDLVSGGVALLRKAIFKPKTQKAKQLSQQLKDLSQEKGCTLYSTLLTGFYILLHKYTSQKEIIIGTPIANRHFSQLEDLIGFFVNSLPIAQVIQG